MQGDYGRDKCQEVQLIRVFVTHRLRVGAEPAAGDGPEGRERPQDLQELWEERTAIMVYDGKVPPTEAVRRAWACLPPPGEER